MLLVPRVRPRCQGSPSRRGVCWPGAGRLGRAAVSWCRASGARCGFLVPGVWGALWFPGAGRLGRCGFLRVRVPGLCVLVWVLSVSVSDSCLWVSAPLFLPLISCLGSQGLHFFLLPFLSSPLPLPVFYFEGCLCLPFPIFLPLSSLPSLPQPTALTSIQDPLPFSHGCRP